MVKQPGSSGDYHKVKYDDDTCDWDYKFYGLKGPLITGEVCGEFAKKFPCVGTQKKDGTHTKDCLNLKMLSLSFKKKRFKKLLKKL